MRFESDLRAEGAGPTMVKSSIIARPRECESREEVKRG